jgi:branched-subunit amino acid aminotransferase/4-amino-4-deoxychorismate lyase
VPPLGKGALYLRPLLMGSGPILGLGPAPAYTFAIYAAAVGSYFKVWLWFGCYWLLCCRLVCCL